MITANRNISSNNHGMMELTLASKEYVETLVYKEQVNHQWVYVISNSLRWQDKTCPIVQLKPQSQADKFLWVEKVIESGQCHLIIVEDLQLSRLESIRLQKKCGAMGVILINLKVGNNVGVNNNKMNNILNGPW